LIHGGPQALNPEDAWKAGLGSFPKALGSHGKDAFEFAEAKGSRAFSIGHCFLLSRYISRLTGTNLLLIFPSHLLNMSLIRKTEIAIVPDDDVIMNCDPHDPAGEHELSGDGKILR